MTEYSPASPTILTPIASPPWPCPCCGFLTLADPPPGTYDICPVCYWEDDGQDDHDADEVRGGPNGALSLSAARANYKQHGASEARFIGSVRKPLPQEL